MSRSRSTPNGLGMSLALASSRLRPRPMFQPSHGDVEDRALEADLVARQRFLVERNGFRCVAREGQRGIEEADVEAGGLRAARDRAVDQQVVVGLPVELD